jgi:hypothetical protein
VGYLSNHLAEYVAAGDGGASYLEGTIAEQGTKLHVHFVHLFKILPFSWRVDV